MDTLYEGAILAVIVVFLFLRDWRATDHRGGHPAAVDLSGLLGHATARLLAERREPCWRSCSRTGILVDDAIVEIENIVRHIRMGKSPYQAALEAADEIGLAVIAISLAIVAVFIPASFMPSVPGQFFKQFGITVSVQVLFSLLCARMITPMLAAYFLRPHQHEEKSDGRAHASLHPACHRGGAISFHHCGPRLAVLRCVLGWGIPSAERLSACHRYRPLACSASNFLPARSSPTPRR